MMNIRLTLEQESTIKEMGSMSTQGKFRIDLNSLEEEVLIQPKTYWFMPCVFEETHEPLKYMIHELPESICEQILEFIKR